MIEVWKPVKDYEGIYEVSNMGNVRSIASGKLKKPFKNKRGYLRVQLFKDKKKKNCRVHRIVAATYIPNPENKPAINHKDCNKNNNCLENLEWVTDKENKEHYKIFLKPILV